MSNNEFRAHKLTPARRGEKTGWPSASGQVPPDLLNDLDRLADALGIQRTDAVRFAVEDWVAAKKAA